MKEPSYPKIELNVKPESAQILVGESATLSWKVQKAQKVYILQASAGMLDGWAVDWQQIGQKGQEVKSEGEMAVNPNISTTYIVAALGKGGRKARSLILEVWREKPKDGEAKSWYQGWEPPPRDWRLDPRRRFDERVRRWLSCYRRNATITFSARPRAVFTDEEATLTWRISCSDCAQMSDGGIRTILVEDRTRRSGTRAKFIEGWGSLPAPCSLSMGDEAEVSALEGPGLYDWNIFAEGSWGSAASATVQVGFIPLPQFDGCNADRQGAIEVALKNIYRRLLDGCIRDNIELDDEVAAFDDGRLDRLALWRWLLAELENINLITFRCVDLDDEDWQGGHWVDYTNEIEIQWSPNLSPDLPYVILHELIHKSGFHGDLLAHYWGDEIEEQTHQVTETCF